MKPREQLLIELKEHTILCGGDAEDDGIAAQLTFAGIGNMLRVIASWGEGWDHVSVSLPGRTPYWSEMCFVKDFFFYPNECVVQYHPDRKDYINNHPHCLHLWRPQNVAIPTPPLQFV